MKRIHLFEFEDLPWFPNSLRMCMTRFIVTMHKVLGSSPELAELIAKCLKYTDTPQVIDMCSGSGGPMLEVYELLKKKHGIDNLKMTLSDLYPHVEAAQDINAMGDPNLAYLTTSVDATNLDRDKKGLRTMVCSLHHMPPDVAHNILKNAKEAQQPICVFEISDNSIPPIWLWWLVIPMNFMLTLFITPFIRPLTWQQILFTYLPPFPLPFLIGWDGAVSNARIYTMKDMDELLVGLESEHYIWEKGVIHGRGTIKGYGTSKSYLLGLPKSNSQPLYFEKNIDV